MKNTIYNEYNSKQALMRALQTLNIPTNLIQNETVLRSINLYNEVLDYSSKDFPDSPSLAAKRLEFLNMELEQTVIDFIERLKNRIIVESDSNKSTMYLLDEKFDKNLKLNSKKDLYAYIINMAQHFPRLSFEITRITNHNQQNETIVEHSKYDIFSEYAKDYMIEGQQVRNIYDASNKIIREETSYYNDRDFDIKRLEEVFIKSYNYRNVLDFNHFNNTLTFTHMNEDKTANFKIENMKVNDNEVELDLEEVQKTIEKEDDEKKINWMVTQLNNWQEKRESFSIVYSFPLEELRFINLQLPIHERIIRKSKSILQ